MLTNRWLSAEGSPCTAAPLGSVGGARLALAGSSLISPLQDPAALGNALGGANVGAGPAGTRRRGRRRRGLWSERGEFGCKRRVHAGSSHPVGGARGRGDPAEPRERPHGVPSGGAVPRAQTHRAEALQRVPRAAQTDQETVQSARLPLETPAQLEDQRTGAAAAELGGLYPGHPILEPGCAQGTTGIPESSPLAHSPQGQQLGVSISRGAWHERGPSVVGTGALCSQQRPGGVPARQQQASPSPCLHWVPAAPSWPYTRA
ncbi:sorting nexin-22 isoform X2 [Delphinus delphis]|uniref:sorting nexin-22 isoform X2 n=1 Tax=Delphinus delphis TaxID=9728 RepID=UPI0028C4A4A9|nr:sorting nexin-22 isoform X2 [Delphinus delphis]